MTKVRSNIITKFVGGYTVDTIASILEIFNSFNSLISQRLKQKDIR